MEDNNIYEQMRSNMDILKKQLDKEKIINEKMLRNTIKTSLSGMSREMIGFSILAILSICYCGWFFTKIGFDLWFFIATAAFMLYCVIEMLLNRQRLNLIMSQADRNLIDCAEQIAQLKQRDINTLKINMSILLLWLMGMGYQIYSISNGNKEFAMGMGTGAVVGLIIGLFFGMKYFNKKQKQMQDNINQIEEWKKLK
jgi:uncharacterized protein YneF (UPF0154 family)